MSFLLRQVFALSLALLWHFAASEQTFRSYDYGSIDRSHIIKRQSSGPYVTSGVESGSGPTGSKPLRLEVRDLENDSAMWTLYMLGLDMMQWSNQTEMLSWYEITGIHGRPYVPFNDVQAIPGNGNNGYCHHISILFPPWHRPYLALYEQILYGIIQNIAQMYPAGTVRDAYTAAAANFRIPYWDWAAVPPQGQSVFPTSVGGLPYAVVDGPVGNQTIANPLFSYQFQPLDPSDLPDAPFNVYPRTVRYPTTKDASAHSQNNLIAQQLDNSAPSYRARLYNLFTNYHNYSLFGNEGWFNSSNNPNGFDSLESIHDQIHGLTGSGGHMTYIDYSAFDPVFWLHHANVDRLFAMWQVLNPESYVIPEPAPYNTFNVRAGQIEDVNTALTPFYKDNSGNFWTSAEVVDTETFGYSYKETAKAVISNVTSQVITAINTMYGPGATSQLALSTIALPTRLTQHTPQSPESNSSSSSREWIANIVVKKYALNKPFFIHVFLGPFNPDPASWSFDSNLCGTHFIQVKGASAIANSPCNCDPDQMVSGTIPITHALQKHVNAGDLKSLNEDDVEAYLAQNLKYRITLPDDSEVSNADVPSLKISVVSVGVQAPKSDTELPTWGEMKGHMDVSTH